MGAPPSAAAAPLGAASGVAPAPEDGTLGGRKLNNRYLVLSHIGEGGFGDVYKAKQIQMNRDVAIKVLSPTMTKDPKLVERFKREAQSACNLRDPHTIITYDFDETEDGLLYIAMELLVGETLFDVMEREGRLPASRVVAIVEQACTSLGEAHTQGIVHRDIKPENIFLEARPDHPDFVKILDFGIAKIVAGEMAQGPALTAAGQTLGTLEYMSPEQLMGQKLDGRSDIYALGMLMHQMLSGALPFGDNASPATMIQWHLRQQAPPPSRVAPGCPHDLDPIVMKMLAKDRDQRYGSVMELRQDLQQLMARHGWRAGGASGPMTAVPPVPLPFPPGASGFPGNAPMAPAAAPAPGPGGPYPGPPFGSSQSGPTAPLTLPVHHQPKSRTGLVVALIAGGVLVLAAAAFLLYWFVFRDTSGPEDQEKAKDGKDAMSAPKESKKAESGPRDGTAAKGRERPRPEKGPREVADASRAAAEGSAPSSDTPAAPSLGGLLAVLGRGPGSNKRASVPADRGAAGALLGAGATLPKAGRVLPFRRARVGIGASEADPLRVVPPEMTLVARVQLQPFRKAPWFDRVLAGLPAAVVKKAEAAIEEVGISLRQLGSVAMGGTFPEGDEAEPILLFAVAGAVDARALAGAFGKSKEEGKGKVRKERISGYSVLAMDDGRLVVPSKGLAILASDRVIHHGLSRMSQPRVRSFLDGGWAPRVLRDAGASASPHLLVGLNLPPAARKASGELIEQLKAGDSSDEVRSILVAAEVTAKGLRLVLGAECSSAKVASRLGAMLPLVVKMAFKDLPRPLGDLVGRINLSATKSTVHGTLDITGEELQQIVGLVAAAL